ncbi:MAG TPA: RNase adapter RapZ, partial [Rubrobacteraceae bacterium]|nr:RNase adapter RapZ [Rubrobacteraceae bacterium]
MSQQTPRATGFPVAERRRIVIITGLSGAGKSNALQAFEDAGYFCIDNLPPRMIPAVMETVAQGNGGPDGVVVVMDIRGRRYFGEELEGSLEAVVEESGWERRILFIESDDRTLVRRYKESRRPHPAARNGDVLAAIRDERRYLATLREKADLVVDTSGYSALDARIR